MKYINVLLYTGMIVMNYLANALPLNNRTTGELSDAYPNLFVPAGITFSIWGVIYIFLGFYCILQFMSSYKTLARKISFLFALTCIFNGLWIACWHYEKVLWSVMVMTALLIALIIINFQIRKIRPGIVKAAFGLYLGWICIATIANVTALLVYFNWDGFGLSEVVWTIIMIFIGTLITYLTIRNLQNPFVGISVIWAFTGIVIKRQDDYFSIVIAALIAITLTAVATIWAYFRKRKSIFE